MSEKLRKAIGFMIYNDLLQSVILAISKHLSKYAKIKTYPCVCQIFPTSADENLHLQKNYKNLSIPRIAQNILQERLQDTPRFLDGKCESADKLLILLAY